MGGARNEPANGSLPAEIRTVAHVLLEKIWLILLVVIVCGSGGIIYLLRTPKVYAATTTIEVGAEEQKPIRIEDRRGDGGRSEEVLKTIEQKLKSPALALRLTRHAELKNDLAFLPKLEKPATESRLAAQVATKIVSSVRRGTRLIDITVEDENAVMAQKLARLVVDEFLSSGVESRTFAAQTAQQSLRAEAERLKARLEKSETALQMYKEQHRAVSLEEKENIVVDRLKELSAKVTAAKAERLRVETDQAQIARANSGSLEPLLALPTVASSEAVVEAKRRVSEKEAEMASLYRRYKSEHPKYVQAASELAELRSARDEAVRKAVAMVGAALEAATTNEHSLEQALHAQEQLALQLSEMAIPYQALGREVQADRALSDSLLARLKESDIAQGISQYPIHVVAAPILPEKPVRPNKRAVLLLASVGGLALGLTLALGFHLIDNSLKTVDQAEQALGLASLAAIPSRGKLPLCEARRLLSEKPHAVIAETFRALRTALLFAGKEHGYRTVLFTSAVPGEGKSFCSINYAVALAQQGYRTLLIDADLRLPSVGAAFLGNAPSNGLSDLLLGRCDLREVVRLTDIDNLSVLPAGTHVAQPAELLGQTGFAHLLERTVGAFERVVIDTAPVHAVSETLLLAAHADAVCLVVRANKTPLPAVTRALQKLRDSRARIVGFVLNALPIRNGGYYYHYHAPGYGRDEVYGATVAAKA